MNIRDVKSTILPVSHGVREAKPREDIESKKTPADSVDISAGSNRQEPVKIQILHMNDMHGAVDPMLDPGISAESPVGGFSNAKGVIDREKQDNPDGTLVLNAGDLAEGSMIAYLSRGKVVAEAVNEMGFDALTLGNHDFAWGQDDLKTMVCGIDAPIVAANIVQEKSGAVMDGLKPYVVKDLKGVKVGIIGLNTPNIGHFVAKPKLEGLEFKDGVETVAKWLPRVKEEADLVVVLSHLGLEEDKKLAREVEGIDVIVGGHSHSQLDEGHREGNTTIVQAGSLTRFVGKLEIEVAPDTKKITGTSASLIPVIADQIEADPGIEKILGPYRIQAEEVGNRVMGKAEEELHYAHREAGKLNQIHADSMLAVTDADFGICNSRTLRGHLPEGEIKFKDLYSSLPFTEENVVTIRATGRQVLQEIEDDLRDGATELAVPTGCRYEYDPTRPQGNRVTSLVTSDGKPIEMDREYTVVMNETMSRKRFFGDPPKDKKIWSPAQDPYFDMIQKGSPWRNNPDDRVKVATGA